MLDQKDIEARKARLAELLGTQLRVRGKTLETRMARAGRLLPKWARRDLEKIVEASRHAGHPKLARMVDLATLDKAEARVTRYLRSLDPVEARKTAWLRLAGLIALNLLIVLGVFLWVIYSLGHL
ncbi:hypothetical protein PGB28_02670 [Primorskyibacter aestuariivivens]|uniref:hypothetical protein n=1 Tax=Primorskyibacter aestuariivivens TaxID=1888912 RepID=UPI002301C037|nr:hypothetical protein [Primorskyibacter aestuariivivens]MDA7427347.1 hypothetical protein [Primorskyibacter aestuariivivens]